MARYKGYDYPQTVMIPVSLAHQCLPGTLEFAVQVLVERRLDMAIFASRYKNDETGCPAYDPKSLLKVILVAYARGIIASRKIEQTCRETIVFMALACGQVPDHSTIAAFVASLKTEIAALFRDILLVCAEHGLLGGRHFAWDGVKLPSTAAGYPWCRPIRAFETPLLILTGELDDWTQAVHCKELAAAVGAQSAPLMLKVYAGAYHAWTFPQRGSLSCWGTRWGTMRRPQRGPKLNSKGFSTNTSGARRLSIKRLRHSGCQHSPFSGPG